uniref:Mitochondrial ribosomal protein S18C n=1 Tax=Riptortus pedestris TaxID=329032 RepID=R4WKN3_RIPPE|nr:mitochondrial ribosomal protein S18C [Riptortus pedestris]
MSLLGRILNPISRLGLRSSSLQVIRNYTPGEKSDTLDKPVDIENPFVKEKQQCILCKLNIKPDYKNARLLSQFVSPFTGRVYGRHVTRLCTHKHELVKKEIVKARNAGFMPYYNKEPAFLNDPKLFNPEKPIRNHDYC